MNKVGIDRSCFAQRILDLPKEVPVVLYPENAIIEPRAIIESEVYCSEYREDREAVAEVS